MGAFLWKSCVGWPGWGIWVGSEVPPMVAIYITGKVHFSATRWGRVTWSPATIASYNHSFFLISSVRRNPNVPCEVSIKGRVALRGKRHWNRFAAYRNRTVLAFSTHCPMLAVGGSHIPKWIPPPFFFSLNTAAIVMGDVKMIRLGRFWTGLK